MSEGKVVVEFEIKFQTVFGQVVYVVGGAPEIGDWNPRSGLRLTWGSGGVWRGTTSIAQQKTPSKGDAIAFKFCVLNDHLQDGGVPYLEPGPDRLLRIGAAGSKMHFVGVFGEGPKLQEVKFDTWPYPEGAMLFRSPMPYAPMFDTQRSVLEEMKGAGVTVVVALASVDEMRGRVGFDIVPKYWQEGLSVIVHPVDDLSVPRDSGAFRRLVDTVHSLLRHGNVVCIHCHAGIGRTGMLMACLAARHLGMKPIDAVSAVRSQVRGALQTDEQVAFVVTHFSTPAVASAPK